MFDGFHKDLQEVCGSGFSPEIIAFGTYFDILLTSISGERRIELELDIHSLEAFGNIGKVLKSICCMSYDLLTQNEVPKGLFSMVIEGMNSIGDK